MVSLSTGLGGFGSAKATFLTPCLSLAIAFVLLASVAILPSRQARAAGSGKVEALCRADEIVLASCQIAKKMASVCGKGGNSVYRFGRPGRIEVEAGRLQYSMQMFAGGGESQIQFRKGLYRYVLFDRMVSRGIDAEGHSPKRVDSGLLVQKGNRKVFERACVPGDAVMLNSNAAPRFMVTGRYVPH